MYSPEMAFSNKCEPGFSLSLSTCSSTGPTLKQTKATGLDINHLRRATDEVPVNLLSNVFILFNISRVGAGAKDETNIRRGMKCLCPAQVQLADTQPYRLK